MATPDGSAYRRNKVTMDLISGLEGTTKAAILIVPDQSRMRYVETHL